MCSEFSHCEGQGNATNWSLALREEARGRSYGRGGSSPARRNDGRDSKVRGANVASRPAQHYAKTGRVQTTLSDPGGRRDDEDKDYPFVAELLLRAGREGRRIAQNSSRHLGSRFAV